MNPLFHVPFILCVLTLCTFGGDPLFFPGKEGLGKGKHIVLLAGDEEYRSEEAMPLLAKILSEFHGFDCTVCFSLNEEGEIDPKAGGSLSHPEALEKADAIVMLIRFRYWDDATMKRFDDAVRRGIPIIALRTSTHPFNHPKTSPWAAWTWNHESGGWGKTVLGETWISHWGKHKIEGTRGVIEPTATEHPVLRGVTDVFADTDVYEVHPPEDVIVLMRGMVVDGLTPDSQPIVNEKKTRLGVIQDVNTPMMPVAWTREYRNPAGTSNRVFCTTMGSATDLANEGVRRLVVNAVFWGLELEVPKEADVSLTEEYQPTPYGFDGFKKGLRPESFLPRPSPN